MPSCRARTAILPRRGIFMNPIAMSALFGSRGVRWSAVRRWDLLAHAVLEPRFSLTEE